MPLKELPSFTSRGGLGSVLGFRRDQLGFLATGVRRHGDLFRFRLLGVPIVLANHPDHIRHVLVDEDSRYDKDAALFKAVKPVLRNGLIAVTDKELWRRQRRMMAPLFTPRTVAGFVRNMTDETERMLERWEGRQEEGRRNTEEAPLDITDEIGQLALRIVNRSLFSTDVSQAAQKFEAAFGTANTVLGHFIRAPFPPLSVPTPRHRRLHRAIDAMDGFVSGVIGERLGNEETAGAPGTPPDLLTFLLRAVDEEDGRGMELGQLHAEVLNLSIGAYETTTNALSWALYLLARHPDVERRLHDEVDQVLGGRTPQCDDLPRLVYTRMIIDETLRLYSPAYQTMRHACEEDVIAGYRIPAGSDILINSYLVHRHPEFWPEAERFAPDNFTPEHAAARPRHAYIPFGSGPRVCIGKHFALAELTLALAMIARRHCLLLPEAAREVEAEPLITLHPRGGIHLRLVRR